MTQTVRFLRGEQVARYATLQDEMLQPLTNAPWSAGVPDGDPVPATGARMVAPVEPGKILAAAVNYRSHALRRPPPTKPELFFKPPSCVVGPEAEVVLPYDAGRVDVEGELVVVIGKPARRVAAADALDHVAGYTAGFDISARLWQRSDRFFWRAKGSDTFGPIGPAVVSSIDLDRARLVTKVNGEVRQDTSVGELIFGVPQLIEFASQSMTLEPGDLIFTGTASVTPEIFPGDRIELEIEGLPVLSNSVVAEAEPAGGRPSQEDRMDRIESRIVEMGLELPPQRPPSIANIEKSVRTGNLLFVSGHGPYNKDGLMRRGRVGQDITIDEGYELARHAALNGLRSAKTALGSLDKIRRVVKLLVFINATPDVFDLPKMANGASDLLVELFGEAGRHARSAMGMASVPNNMPVEIEMILEVE